MILLTGASGQLGLELIAEAKRRDLQVESFDRKQWSIDDLETTNRLLKARPGSVVINCAAYTAVDRAESDPAAAFRANSEAVDLLYRSCLEHDVLLIHISTDFVFGRGSENDCRPIEESAAPHPEGVYARSKAEGEQRILQHAGGNHTGIKNCLIVRTSWVFGSYGQNFPSTILRLASESNGKELRVVDDQIGRPTWAARLASFLLGPSCIELTRERGGIVHFSNNGVASWYDFACATLEIGAEVGLIDSAPDVIPIASDEMTRPAPRPHFSVMDLRKARTIYPPWPHWRDDLRTFLLDLRAKKAAR